MFGAHMSVAGGLHHAVARGLAIGCDCLQIFVKNQRQWQARPLGRGAISAWHQAVEGSSLSPLVAHSAYLINLASPDRAKRRRSLAALTDELRRCHQLAVGDLVLHPGSHMGAGESAGLRRVAAALRQVLDRTAGLQTRLLLETTAGQGSALGAEFEHLAELFHLVGDTDRLGACLDTCHVFAAGYDLSTAAGYRRVLAEFETRVGLGKLHCLHCNDSKGECGSRLDRHEHIGRGHIGSTAFECLVNDTRLDHIPKIIETPKGKDAHGRDFDRLNLARLRRMCRRRTTAAGGPGHR